MDNKSKLYSFLNEGLKENKEDKNWFESLTLQEIEDAEKRIGVMFPSQLRQFYIEVGYGSVHSNHDCSVVDDSYANRLLDPGSVADIKLLGYESGQVVPGLEFRKNEIPIFEVADGAHFFTMRLEDTNRNTVYDMEKVIAASFKEFISKLYFESPIFYVNLWNQ